MHDTLSGRAEELGRLTDLIRTSLSLADSSIPTINAQLDELAAMGLDNLELEGPLVYSRAANCSPNFDDARVVFAATLVMPGGLGCTIWGTDDFRVPDCRVRHPKTSFQSNAATARIDSSWDETSPMARSRPAVRVGVRS